MRRTRLVLVPVAAALLLSACGSSSSGGTTSSSAAATASESASESASPSATCSPESLETLNAGKLTIATGEPVFPPWMLDDDPTSGKGFESAVAYAVAKQLGYDNADVTWVRTTFDSAIAPGPKTFDFNIQQYSITDERKKVVDFSSGYYALSQVVISNESSPIAKATTVAELKGARLGAAIGTTSLKAIEEQIQPTEKAQVFNDNAAAVTALKNKQIDGIVVDLPTAFYLAFVEIDKGVIVGQLPDSAAANEQLGLLLAKDSPITQCVSGAVDALREDGTLAALEKEWLADQGAPVLAP
ncbi:ABC transporter substrate-binding protein [Longivirga aurantiaca]|uniref:ABC transporter substrate-binding protein n=1 Tax=Longivirga aurantiaca TaxID=1837743 RepID=A0ABW1T5C1_9ACTN